MGDILRQYLKLIGHALAKAALPALITTYCLLFWYRFYCTEQDFVALAQSDLLIILLLAHITWAVVCYIYEASARPYPVERMDREIVGKEFGGMRKTDRVFCDSLLYLVQDDVMSALEGFLSLPMDRMTKAEQGITHFYIARCYQVTGCPSNAVQNYREARDCGFDSVFLLLFLARSFTDGGSYDEAYAVYQELLGRETTEFSCVRTDLGMMYLRKRDGETALKWFQESIERAENYAFALGGCSLAYLLLGNAEESQNYYEQAVINHMTDLEGFKQYRQELEELVDARPVSMSGSKEG